MRILEEQTPQHTPLNTSVKDCSVFSILEAALRCAPGLRRSALSTLLILALAGCKSDDERAEEYFQSGLVLVQAGDPDRAMVEFRNVFQFNEAHLPTRLAIADILANGGDEKGAYSQLLRAAEQYPEEFAVRAALSEMAFEATDWDEFERHGTKAIELSPDVARTQAISLGMRYRKAVLADKDDSITALTRASEALLESSPDNPVLNYLLLDSYIRNGNLDDALRRLDQLIRLSPDERGLYTQRLSLLSQMRDNNSIEAQLRDMLERFPDDTDIQVMLLRFYVSQEELELAETFLREISDPAASEPTAFFMLMHFLSDVKGPEAARQELRRAIAENPMSVPFRVLLAGLDFQLGERGKAVSDLKAVLDAEDLNAPQQQIHAVKIGLAKMLREMGDETAARRLVGEVLQEDALFPEALKLHAAAQLQDDEVDASISTLRRALDMEPEDIEALKLLANSYARAGKRDLARNSLALAVEASGNAPETTLQYVEMLLQEERLLPAEDVLVSAMELNPDHLGLLTTLGSLYIKRNDASRATQVVDTLRRIGTEDAINSANQIQVSVVKLQDGVEDAILLLEELATSEDAALEDKFALMRGQLGAGMTDEALNLALHLVDDHPDIPQLQLALASAQTAAGEFKQAEETLRSLIGQNPKQALAWLAMSRLMGRQGEFEASHQAIEGGLVENPNDPNLLWAHASFLEREGDVAGAIEIYEALYKKYPDSLVVANNLASLLSSHSEVDGSLERGWHIVRRFRDTNVPAFQDTFGWILFKRGEAEEALPYLQSSAAGLQDDPIVQVHLGLVYANLGRNEYALEQLQKGIAMAGPADTRPIIERAREEISRIRRDKGSENKD